MTMEEYGDYAITVMHLRGGPQPAPRRLYNPHTKTWEDGWGIKRQLSKHNWNWEYDVTGYSRREVAIRYCWKHGLITRGGKKYDWRNTDFSKFADTHTKPPNPRTPT